MGRGPSRVLDFSPPDQRDIEWHQGAVDHAGLLNRRRKTHADLNSYEKVPEKWLCRSKVHDQVEYCLTELPGAIERFVTVMYHSNPIQNLIFGAANSLQKPAILV